MRADPVLKYFYDKRSEILKQGVVGEVTSSMMIWFMDDSDMTKLMQNPPPGVKSFFTGDQFGGVGWELELPDGSTEKYYVALPDDVAVETRLHFSDPPRAADTSIEGLANYYVEYLRRPIAEADTRFA